MKKGLLMSVLSSIGILFSLNLVSAAWSFSDVLNQWAQMDVFTYVLPFLLVFAVVYGILNNSKIFGDDAKGVNIIIALALGLLSLVGGYVSEFFQQLAPNLGIGISVLLAGIILVGLFLGDRKSQPGKFLNYMLIGLALLVFIFVIYSSFSYDYLGMGNLWYDYGSALVTLLIIVGIIALIVFWGKNSSTAPAH